MAILAETAVRRDQFGGVGAAAGNVTGVCEEA
jgi:hypothetical protein